MFHLLPALSQDKLDNQRDVVKNERRQRYENPPYGMAWVYLANALYPDQSHPYHHSVIGSHADLTAASFEDVKAFFGEYYVPANAVVTVVGDATSSQVQIAGREVLWPRRGGRKACATSPSTPHSPDQDRSRDEDRRREAAAHLSRVADAVALPTG